MYDPNQQDHQGQAAAHPRLPISGDDEPVDHHRQPGVPPPATDDYDGDLVDVEGAESFPASDPPGHW